MPLTASVLSGNRVTWRDLVPAHVTSDPDYAMQTPVEPLTYGKFRIFWVHKRTSESLRKKIIRLWLDNKALLDQQEAARRAHETACIVLNEHDELVGASTVYPGKLKDAGNTFWFYRTFVDPACRKSGLSSRVFRFTRQQLAATAAAPGSPVGLVVVAENAKFKQPGGRRKLERLGLRPVGTGARGNEVWMLKF